MQSNTRFLEQWITTLKNATKLCVVRFQMYGAIEVKRSRGHLMLGWAEEALWEDGI